MRRRGRTSERGGYSSTAGLGFDDEEFESQLVWIWTMARSGSTWLLRMLTHPLRLVDSSKDPDDMLGFVAPRTWQGTVDAIPVDTTFISNHLLPLSGQADYTDELEPITFSAALGLRNRGNYFFSPKYEDAWLPELRRMMLVRFHRLVERTGERYDINSPLVLLKEVAGAHAAPLVMSMFPRSKLVFLVRDGRDVVDSQTAANQPGTWLPVSGWKTDEERHEFIRRRARTWVGDVASIKRAFEAHPAERRKLVRYEDLLAAPAENVGSLMEWLGLHRGEQWLQRAVEANSFDAIAPEQKGPKKFFRSATPGAWQQNMSDEEAATLQKVMGGKLRELGYPVSESPSEPDDGSDGGGQSSPDNEAELDDQESEAAPSSGPPGSPGPPGQGKGTGDLVSAIIRSHGEGRDYSGLGRLVRKRGTPTSRRDRKVALTFDDGPVLQTHRVLATLERFDARGTFFLVGYKMDGHQRLINRILAAGHEIGNHSHAHFAFPTHEDVAACSALIRHIAGISPRLFRPPFGAVDRPAAEATIGAGMQVILWSVDSKDGIPPWKGISAEEITRNVLDHIAPGAIVLLHDGLPWSRAADALPALLEGLRGKGYRFVTVSELLADSVTWPQSPVRRAMRRLRRRLGPTEGSSAPVTPRASVDPDAGGSTPTHGAPTSDPEHLAELLRTLAEGVEPPSENGEGPTTTALIRGACETLADGRAASDLLARHAARCEANGVRVMALGFSLRRFESADGGAAPLAEPFMTRVRSADEPGAEAGFIAEELAGRMRVDRLVAVELAKRAETAEAAVMPHISEATELVKEPGFEHASPEFLSIFAPGSETWENIEAWADDTCRGIARQRMRALLDVSGVGREFDIERLINRLDVEFFFRYGYALAACEEEISDVAS